jgi:ribonuclease HI
MQEPTTGKRPSANLNHRWQLPPDGWVKINVDGSYVEATREAGVGAIARDEMGKVIFSAWRYFDRCGSAAEAEALACVEGLQRALQRGVTQVIIETDCSRVMSALKSLDRDKSEIGVVVAEAKGLTYLLGD